MIQNVSDMAELLIEKLTSFGPTIIAFSGGVDSSVVAAAAVKCVPFETMAVTANSPSVPQWQLNCAKRIAAQIGIQHLIVETNESEREEYIRNDANRCFYCKESLYRSLSELASLPEFSSAATIGFTIVSGTNADDLSDYRPGIEAGRNAEVQTPLADLGIDKLMVRQLAKHFGLDNAELPASPCLASRVAYGVEVTPERLLQIEQAEAWLRNRSFSDCRVRFHQEDLARVEVPQNELFRLLNVKLASEMNLAFRSIGFRYVTIDVQGLTSGNMNQTLVAISDRSES